MRCAKCGGVLQAGARFCAECGTAVPVVTPLPPGLSVMRGRSASRNPSRLVVDASGGEHYEGRWRLRAFATIATAVEYARGGDTILLRPGTYREPRGITISGDVHIKGQGGRSEVIVEGAPGADVFKFRGGSATLTGLTIRVVGTGPADQSWSAIVVRAGTPVIEDCDLTSSAGPAVSIVGAWANPLIRKCTIRDSRDAGVRVSDQGQGTFTANTLEGNARGAWDIQPSAESVTRTGNWPPGWREWLGFCYGGLVIFVVLYLFLR